MMRKLAILAGILFLAGCNNAPQSGVQPDMTFANLQPIQLNVADIEVRNDYKSPMAGAYVEHLFQTPPAMAAEKLIKRQLAAAGGTETLRVVIEDASVMREELPVTKGLTDIFKQEPAERLKARVLLRFERFTPQAPDITTASAEVVAKHEKTLLEGISPADRDRAYFDLTESLMRDLDSGLRTVVKDTFGEKF